MQAMHISGESYFCHDCEKHFQGRPTEERRLADSYDQGTRESDVYWDEVYLCHDGNPPGSNPCVLYDDGNFSYYDDTWQCGNCDSLHGDLPSAANCCR